MATGSGKTKVMALAIVWQYFNAVREDDEQYAKTFLVLAPNVIVFERLKEDFANGNIFRTDPLFPRHFKLFWEMECYMRGEAQRTHSNGALYLTNIQQFYERANASKEEEPAEITALLGDKPQTQKLELTDFAERIAQHEGLLLVLNDEAHHTHDEDSEWNQVIRRLHSNRPIAAQLDFSATPRYTKGGLFAWTISDYPLKQAIVDNIVKRPIKGISKIEEAKSALASVKYEGAKANILPEQTIGRGLRLMFRGSSVGGYRERVDIIGNQAFLKFVEDLEKLEGLKLDTFQLGKDKLKIYTVMPVAEKQAVDIAIPELSPTLGRKTSLAEEIAAINIMDFATPVLPLKANEIDIKNFTYDCIDALNKKKLFERVYEIPPAQTPEEVIGYYARLIAQHIKLPSQFAALAPKIQEFFGFKAFGKEINLYDGAVIQAMSTNLASYIVTQAFEKVLRQQIIEEIQPTLLSEAKQLSTTPPFPFSRLLLESDKTVFNYVACDNEFERDFAQFLNRAEDIIAFAKLPAQFGFSIQYTDSRTNLRHYYPDFVVKRQDGQHWLIETKGREDIEVKLKDEAASYWCKNATHLCKVTWDYLKVPQNEFEKLQPSDFDELRIGLQRA